MGIVGFALRLPHTFYVLASLILFLGITAIVSMPTDIFPEINIPVVTVIWQYTGLSTPEMEQRVTTYRSLGRCWSRQAFHEVVPEKDRYRAAPQCRAARLWLRSLRRWWRAATRPEAPFDTGPYERNLP